MKEKNMFSRLLFLTAKLGSGSALSLGSTLSYAHTGLHTELYHPLSGVDHFTVMLIIALAAGIAGYYFYKK